MLVQLLEEEEVVEDLLVLQEKLQEEEKQQEKLQEEEKQQLEKQQEEEHEELNFFLFFSFLCLYQNIYKRDYSLYRVLVRNKQVLFLRLLVRVFL